ncbi:hypothetical protein ABL78_5831 [Leptomonas seymouri]|uniref:Uncharacterized protein n=1 Tax=Leptomonas seymouri TaxID=5684 RepID=A0A0N0P4B6_LEPSE|nr:hypothetical protein ABL78_5831 [Leptomonas seymouri]|eukprot:KPI85106.1 hypothetical protein ABL78_5831 [Leptomonas seymouri]
MNRVRRRPNSSIPLGASNAAPSEHGPQQRRYTASPSPYRTPLEVCFSDTYGRPVVKPASFRRGIGGSDGAVYDEGRNANRHHHLDITRSPSQSRQAPPLHRDIEANTREDGASTNRSNDNTDAIVFQYYSRRMQQRREHQQELRTRPDNSATPVKQQCRRGANRTEPVERQSPSSAPPPLARRVADAAAQDALLWLMPSIPLRDAAALGAMKATPFFSPCSAQSAALQRVQSPTRLPSTFEQRVLAAAAHQHESHRLLHYYGGIYAVKSSNHEVASEEEEPSALFSSLLTSPVCVAGTTDSRSALLEALQRQMDLLRCADMASRAPTSTTSEGGASRRSLARGKAEGSTSPGRTADADAAALAGAPPMQRPHEQHTSVEGAVKSPGDARRPRKASAGGRAPGQLRSRVMASRASAASRDRSNVSSDGASGAAARRSPNVVSEFLRTIKPPHRHGLGRVSPPISTTSPQSTSPMIEAAHVVGALWRDGNRERSPLLPEKERRSSAPAQPHDRPREESHPSPRATSQRSACRGPPLSDVFEDVLPGILSDFSGAKLSPGAAAARRVYWERHQSQQQQRRSDSGEPQRFPQFKMLVGDGLAAAPRYPESISTENVTRNTPLPQHHGFGTTSLDDSVLRSDGQNFTTAPAEPHESLAALSIDTPPSVASDAIPRSPPRGEALPHALQQTQPGTQHAAATVSASESTSRTLKGEAAQSSPCEEEDAAAVFPQLRQAMLTTDSTLSPSTTVQRNSNDEGGATQHLEPVASEAAAVSDVADLESFSPSAEITAEITAESEDDIIDRCEG